MLALFAFLSAPAAFMLVWILYRQTRNSAERYLAFAVLANSYVLLGNLLTALIEGSTNTPYGVYVLLLDEVTIFTIMGGACVCRFAHDTTRTRLPAALVGVFRIWAFLLHAVILASAVLPGAGGVGQGVSKGFAVATLAALVMLTYATVAVIAGSRRIPSGFVIPHPVGSMLVVLVLGVLAAANDLFQVGTRLGGVAIPFSPFFAILIDGFLIAVVERRLVAGSHNGGKPEGVELEGAVSGIGLTVRESEILPFLLEGASNEEIGDALHISPHTVKNHISVILRKSGARNRFDLLKTFKGTTAG